VVFNLSTQRKSRSQPPGLCRGAPQDKQGFGGGWCAAAAGLISVSAKMVRALTPTRLHRVSEREAGGRANCDATRAKDSVSGGINPSLLVLIYCSEATSCAHLCKGIKSLSRAFLLECDLLFNLKGRCWHWMAHLPDSSI